MESAGDSRQTWFKNKTNKTHKQQAREDSAAGWRQTGVVKNKRDRQAWWKTKETDRRDEKQKNQNKIKKTS